MGILGNISPEGTMAIGIVVGLLSTAIQSLGLTLQRQSHLREDAKIAPETRKPPYKRPKWQAGMLMFVMANLIGSTIQITTLPLPVLSTLQAAGLVFNTAFATILLKEPFTKFSLIGTLLTAGGAALIAVFGAIAEPSHNLNQLLELLGKEAFIVWMAMTLAVAAATLVIAHLLKVYSSHKHMMKHLHKTERPRSSSKVDMHPEPRPRRLSITAQLPRPLQLRVKRLRLIRGLCFALVSGILSAHSLLVAKSAVELIVRTIVDHDNQFNRFQSWLILLALLFFALSQLYYLHLGLRLCSTSVLYPFVFCIYNIVAILDGLIYFRQASRLTLLHGILVAVGTAILLSGVLALSWRLDESTPTEAAPQLVAPQTPLAPGMGIFRHSEEFDASNQESLVRANTDPSCSNERTPLLARPARRATLTKNTISPGGAGARDIWAELDDDEDAYDFLISGSRSSSPQLRSNPKLDIPKNRRSGSLPPADANDSDADCKTKSRRAQTLHTYRQESAQNIAAMLSSPLMPPAPPEQERRGVLGSSERQKPSRDRRTTVHFEEENLQTTSPNRSRIGLGVVDNPHRGRGQSKPSSSKDQDGEGRTNDPG